VNRLRLSLENQAAAVDPNRACFVFDLSGHTWLDGANSTHSHEPIFNPLLNLFDSGFAIHFQVLARKLNRHLIDFQIGGLKVVAVARQELQS
jgi:hypothetical protein